METIVRNTTVTHRRRDVLRYSVALGGLLATGLRSGASAQPIPQLMLNPVPGSALSGRVTIDNDTQNDNGYLANARNNNPNAGSHGNFQEAVNNLLNQPRNKVLIGHGNDGIIVTGTGQVAIDSTKYVSNDNVAMWQPAFAKLKGGCESLQLWSCHTGADQAGADLLFKLAQTLNCIVQGASGFVFDNSNGEFWLEPGATWVMATPSHKPASVAPPPPHFDLRFGVMEIAGGGDQGMKRLEASQVTAISIIPNPVPGGGVPGAVSTVSGAAAKALFGQMGISEPFRVNGVPGALVTGRFAVGFEDGTQVTLGIFNGRLLQNESQPSTFYYCSSNISSVLLSNIKRPG